MSSSSLSSTKRCRIGIDVGGTFTDFVLHDPDADRIVRFKESSVPEDPSLSVMRGLPQLLERAGKTPDDIELVVHGTTLALNAMIQRRGARLGLLVSRGNRGVLEIGRTQLSSAFSFLLDKEQPLVPRNLVMECSARLAFGGEVVSEATDEEIEAAAAKFREAKLDAVVVMLLHAPSNPGFEAAVAKKLAALMGDVPVTASAEIWPEDREFERSLVALINAYIQPIMVDYLNKLETRVRSLGLEAPIYITSNNGGTLSIRTALERPIDTILSGPASGVVAASVVSKRTPYANIVTVDIGGTSADMSIIQKFEPSQTTHTTIGNLPLTVPVVAVSAIGAGGGSIVWIDDQGAMKVGPQSAGASPGPACYGRGGTEPTLTDCYLVAGYIDERHFLGGRLKLDREASERALRKVSDRLGYTGEEAIYKVADAAIRITTAMMSSEVARSMARHGEDVSDYTLVAFGGAGPTHAAHLAGDAGMKSVIIPTAPSTFCALGAILAEVKRDFIASTIIDIDGGPEALTRLTSIYAELKATARTWIEPDLGLLGNVRFEGTLDMRYAGQSFSLPVAISESDMDNPNPAALREAFNKAHAKLYGYDDPEADIEITVERLRIVSGLPPIELPILSVGEGGAPIESRRLYLDGKFHEAAVYRREALAAGQKIAAPAIVEQEDTTTMILPGWVAEVDSRGNLILSAA